jgi:acyl-ACP thioesterase
MPTTRVAYPRAAEGFDGKGNSLFKVISIWVIVDMDTRAMVLPGKSGVDVAGTVLGTELKAPGGLPAGTFTNSGFRTVSYSDLDVNGHMNNTRYLDWVCDLLPSAFHRDHPLKAATICYMTEALEGQQLQLSWSGEETIRVDGSLPQTDVDAGHTRIFSAQLEF